MTNELSEEEMELDKEVHVHHFNSDPTVHQYESDMRIDHRWVYFDSFPCLRKLVLAVLNCFHGPLVEWCFNIMIYYGRCDGYKVE